MFTIPCQINLFLTNDKLFVKCHHKFKKGKYLRLGNKSKNVPSESLFSHYKMKSSLVVLVICFICFAHSVELGDGLWRTFNLALLGEAPALPITVATAKNQGWELMDNTCDPNLGYRYAYKDNAPGKSTPLTIYYTAAGQVAGLGVDVFGEGSAPDKLVNMGYWISVGKNQWTISVSFRDTEYMCSNKTANQAIGDRIIINQGSINQSIPLTASDAYCNDWTFGSCMKTMGQHWFYDVSDAPTLSWQSENLLPVVAMYYPPTINGTINAIFFATPVAQPGSDYLLYKPGDWETPSLTPSQMCENFCNEDCEWPGVHKWSTMHIYLNSQWSYISCEGGSGFLSILCPAATSMTTSC